MIPHAETKKKDDEVSIVSDLERLSELKWYHKIINNRPFTVITVLILVSILAPTLLYRFVFFSGNDVAPPDGHSIGSCIVSRAERIPCGVGDMPHSECHPQCCYDFHNHICYHRVPSRFSYLILPIQNWTEEVVMTPRFPTVPYKSQPSVTNLRLSIDEVSSTHLTLTFYDPRNMTLNGSRIDDKAYNYQISTPELNINVNSSSGSIFNTIRGPLIASNNIWEIVFKLTEQSMYGLGELPLKPGTVKPIYRHNGDASSVPLIFARTNDTYHGLLIDIATPTEVSIGYENQVTIRSITKTGLRFHLFVGPRPKDIMRDVMSIIGSYKQLDYWMLGAHVCSDIPSTDAEALSRVTNFITNSTRARIPFESHCGLRPITFDTEPVAPAPVANAARAIINARKRYVPQISPYIRFKEEDIAINETSTSNVTQVCSNIVCEFEDNLLQMPFEPKMYTGKVGEKSIVYPDYTSENVTKLLDRLWAYNVVLNGAILENNWPIDNSVKAHNETYLELPYFSQSFEVAFNDTPQWNARRSKGECHLYNHNNYGNEFIDAFERKFNVTPSIPIWSSSQWMRANAVINRQHIATSWTNLRVEMVTAALGGASGHWLWSSPICGDTDNFDKERHASLCVKWYMAATYFPLIRIHAKTTPRDALAFEGTHQNLIANTLNRRMTLMPYFFSVLQEGPLLRPMFYQFPSSEALADLSSQFSVGDDLLIVPNFQPLQTHVHVWMPPGIWYEFWGGLRIEAEENEAVTLTTTEADFLTLMRGGSIMMIQKTVMDAADTTRRNSDFALIVATVRRNITTENEEEMYNAPFAEGHIKMAPNMTIFFTATDRELLITAKGDNFNSFCGGSQAVWASTIREINIYGLDEEFNNFDNYRNINIMMGINLCNLRTRDIVHTLF